MVHGTYPSRPRARFLCPHIQTTAGPCCPIRCHQRMGRTAHIWPKQCTERRIGLMASRSMKMRSEEITGSYGQCVLGTWPSLLARECWAASRSSLGITLCSPVPAQEPFPHVAFTDCRFCLGFYCPCFSSPTHVSSLHTQPPGLACRGQGPLLWHSGRAVLLSSWPPSSTLL